MGHAAAGLTGDGLGGGIGAVLLSEDGGDIIFPDETYDLLDLGGACFSALLLLDGLQQVQAGSLGEVLEAVVEGDEGLAGELGEFVGVKAQGGGG